MYVYKVLTNFGHTVEKYLSLGGGADRSGRNAKSCYREQPGEIAGCINVACWHALAHTVSMLVFILHMTNTYEVERLQKPYSQEINSKHHQATPRALMSFTNYAASPTSSTRFCASLTPKHTKHTACFERNSSLSIPTFEPAAPSIHSFSKAVRLFTIAKRQITSIKGTRASGGLLSSLRASLLADGFASGS